MGVGMIILLSIAFICGVSLLIAGCVISEELNAPSGLIVAFMGFISVFLLGIFLGEESGDRKIEKMKAESSHYEVSEMPQIDSVVTIHGADTTKLYIIDFDHESRQEN